MHHEPTIDRDEVRRHITVVVLTPTRLILCHTDEHAPDDLLPKPYTSTSTEAIKLDQVRSVVVNRMVATPARGSMANVMASMPRLRRNTISNEPMWRCSSRTAMAINAKENTAPSIHRAPRTVGVSWFILSARGLSPFC